MWVEAITWKNELLSLEFVDRLWNRDISSLSSNGPDLEKRRGNVCVAPGPEAADHGNVNFARSVRGGPDMVTEPGSSLTYA